MNPENQSRLAAFLHPGEVLLWQGEGGISAAPAPGVLARLFGRRPTAQSGVLYAITPRRVLALPPQGEPQEWFLMLGMIQRVEEQPDGSGSIIFDYDVMSDRKIPRGLIAIPQVERVKNLLADAIDAAYNASPWSV